MMQKVVFVAAICSRAIGLKIEAKENVSGLNDEISANMKMMGLLLATCPYSSSAHPESMMEMCFEAARTMKNGGDLTIPEDFSAPVFEVIT